MQTLTFGTSTYRLSPTRNVGELQAKFSKCTGKTKRSAIAKERRSFPVFKPGDSTADYVRAFYAFNSLNGAAQFFEPLNSEPCTLYTGEDTHETIADDLPAVETGAPIVAESVADAVAPEVAPQAATAPESAPDAPVKANGFRALAVAQQFLESLAHVSHAADAVACDAEARRLRELADETAVLLPDAAATCAEAARILAECAADKRAIVRPAPSANDVRAAEEIVESCYATMRGDSPVRLSAETIEGRATWLRGSANGFADFAPERGAPYALAADILQSHACQKREAEARGGSFDYVSEAEFEATTKAAQARAAREEEARAAPLPTVCATPGAPLATQPAGPFCISAMNIGGDRVHAIFGANRDRSGDQVGFYMPASAYRAIHDADANHCATPDEFRAHGELTPAPTDFVFDRPRDPAQTRPAEFVIGSRLWMQTYRVINGQCIGKVLEPTTEGPACIWPRQAAPIAGLEVAELSEDEARAALAEVRPIEPARAADLREKAQAAAARPAPRLRIPAGDLRASIPARFTPCYALRG